MTGNKLKARFAIWRWKLKWLETVGSGCLVLCLHLFGVNEMSIWRVGIIGKIVDHNASMSISSWSVKAVVWMEAEIRWFRYMKVEWKNFQELDLSSKWCILPRYSSCPVKLDVSPLMPDHLARYFSNSELQNLAMGKIDCLGRHTRTDIDFMHFLCLWLRCMILEAPNHSALTIRFVVDSTISNRALRLILKKITRLLSGTLSNVSSVDQRLFELCKSSRLFWGFYYGCKSIIRGSICCDSSRASYEQSIWVRSSSKETYLERIRLLYLPSEREHEVQAFIEKSCPKTWYRWHWSTIIRAVNDWQGNRGSVADWKIVLLSTVCLKLSRDVPRGTPISSQNENVETRSESYLPPATESIWTFVEVLETS